jgi:hypothetical protein
LYGGNGSATIGKEADGDLCDIEGPPPPWWPPSPQISTQMQRFFAVGETHGGNRPSHVHRSPPPLLQRKPCQYRHTQVPGRQKQGSRITPWRIPLGDFAAIAAESESSVLFYLVCIEHNAQRMLLFCQSSLWAAFALNGCRGEHHNQ